MTTKTNTKSTKKSTKSKSIKVDYAPAVSIPATAAVCIGIVSAALGACAVGALTLAGLGKTRTETIPTLARAEKVCADYNGAAEFYSAKDFVALADSDPDHSVRPDDYDVLLTYVCSYGGNSHATGIEFGEVFFDDGAAAFNHTKTVFTDNQSNGLLEDATILENSSDYLKYYQALPEEENVFYVASTKNASVSLYAPTTKIAEQVLADLGFPNRSHASD